MENKSKEGGCKEGSEDIKKERGNVCLQGKREKRKEGRDEDDKEERSEGERENEVTEKVVLDEGHEMERREKI